MGSAAVRVRVDYFAILRERAGVAGEFVETTAATAAELYRELDARHGFGRMPSLKVAINEEFADWHAPIRQGDTIVFIPPVAGG